jgi:hypothetical protein
MVGGSLVLLRLWNFGVPGHVEIVRSSSAGILQEREETGAENSDLARRACREMEHPRTAVDKRLQNGIQEVVGSIPISSTSGRAGGRRELDACGLRA